MSKMSSAKPSRKKAKSGAKRRYNSSVAPIVRGPGVQHKFYDTYIEGDVVSNAADMSGALMDPTITRISTPLQGDRAIDRIGKKITIDTIMIEGVLSTPARVGGTSINNGTPSPTVFVALVLDSQTNGADFLSEDCFSNPSASIFLSASPLKNLYNATRFTTLKTWGIDMPLPNAASNQVTSSVSTIGANVRFSCFLKVNIDVNFNGSEDALISAVSDNSLHMVAFNNVALSFVEMSYNARIRFTG